MSKAGAAPQRSAAHLRTVARLAAILEVSQDARPTFFLGAGASYRSGVPLASDATQRIAREAFARQRLGTNAVATVKPSDYLPFLRQQPWFIKDNNALAESFPYAVQYLLTPASYRRDFFARELRAHNDLSDGYIALAKLAQRGLWRVLLTTNFDACSADALARLSPHVRRPIEFDLNKEQARAFDIYSSHPQIIYLHGRVETYTARSTADEIASLPEWLPEMLAPVLSASPVVVVGYRGAEASIMNGLFNALCGQSGNFRAGVYWCRLESEALHPRVGALQDAIGTNFFDLPIEGFDELLVDLNLRLASQDIFARSASQAGSRGSSTAPDEALVPGTTMADLDQAVLLSTLTKYCARVERPPVNSVTSSGLLQEQGLARLDEGELRPTVAGLLLFGRDVQAHFPHAFVELTFGGKRRQIIRGNLITQHARLLDILSGPDVNREIRLKTEKSSRKVSAYHARSVNEMVVNLLVHRDYAIAEPSRIDVSDGEGIRFANPGGVPEPIVRDLVPSRDGPFEPKRTVTYLRNAALADVFYGLGPMDKSGSGLCDALDLMRENGGEARFAVEDGNSHFIADLLQARQASPGASNTAIALHPYGIYITNHLRISVLPTEVTVIPVATGQRLDRVKGSDLFGAPYDDAPVQIVQKDRIVSFAPASRLLGIEAAGTRIATEVFRATRGGIGTLSHLLREHLVRYLKRFLQDGLIVEYSGHRAYFVKRGETTPTIRYDTPRRQGIEREMVKRRDYREETFHENEGIAFSVVWFDQAWAFEIKPFYMFTGPDGVTPLPPQRRTRLATSRMRFDRNPSVRSDLTFWARYLSQGDSIIRLSSERDYALTVEPAFHEFEVLETDGGATEGDSDGA